VRLRFEQEAGHGAIGWLIVGSCCAMVGSDLPTLSNFMQRGRFAFRRDNVLTRKTGKSAVRIPFVERDRPIFDTPE
jgi:hypothetical protein